MAHYRILYGIFCCLLVGILPRHSPAEEIGDMVDIFEAKGKVIAVIEGKRKVSGDLRSTEKVLWHGSSGYLGAFLTTERFLVVSVSSSGWQVLPLRLDETGNGRVSVSQHLAVLATEDRIVGFSAMFNQFVELGIPIGDTLLSIKAVDKIAVVVTSGYVIGLTSRMSEFSKISLRIKETVAGVNITPGTASVRTSERLLTLAPEGSAWVEHTFN